MTKLYIRIMDLLRSERGQDMVEYALITVIVSVAVVIATIGILGPAFETWAGDIEACITAPGGATCPFPV